MTNPINIPVTGGNLTHHRFVEFDKKKGFGHTVLKSAQLLKKHGVDEKSLLAKFAAARPTTERVKVGGGFADAVYKDMPASPEYLAQYDATVNRFMDHVKNGRIKFSLYRDLENKQEQVVFHAHPDLEQDNSFFHLLQFESPKNRSEDVTSGPKAPINPALKEQLPANSDFQSNAYSTLTESEKKAIDLLNARTEGFAQAAGSPAVGVGNMPARIGEIPPSLPAERGVGELRGRVRSFRKSGIPGTPVNLFNSDISVGSVPNSSRVDQGPDVVVEAGGDKYDPTLIPGFSRSIDDNEWKEQETKKIQDKIDALNESLEKGEIDPDAHATYLKEHQDSLEELSRAISPAEIARARSAAAKRSVASGGTGTLSLGELAGGDTSLERAKVLVAKNVQAKEADAEKFKKVLRAHVANLTSQGLSEEEIGNDEHVKKLTDRISRITQPSTWQKAAEWAETGRFVEKDQKRIRKEQRERARIAKLPDSEKPLTYDERAMRALEDDANDFGYQVHHHSMGTTIVDTEGRTIDFIPSEASTAHLVEPSPGHVKELMGKALMLQHFANSRQSKGVIRKRIPGEAIGKDGKVILNTTEYSATGDTADLDRAIAQHQDNIMANIIRSTGKGSDHWANAVNDVNSIVKANGEPLTTKEKVGTLIMDHGISHAQASALVTHTRLGMYDNSVTPYVPAMGSENDEIVKSMRQIELLHNQRTKIVNDRVNPATDADIARQVNSLAYDLAKTTRVKTYFHDDNLGSFGFDNKGKVVSHLPKHGGAMVHREDMDPNLINAVEYAADKNNPAAVRMLGNHMAYMKEIKEHIHELAMNQLNSNPELQNKLKRRISDGEGNVREEVLIKRPSHKSVLKVLHEYSSRPSTAKGDSRKSGQVRLAKPLGQVAEQFALVLRTGKGLILSPGRPGGAKPRPYNPDTVSVPVLNKKGAPLYKSCANQSCKGSKKKRSDIDPICQTCQTNKEPLMQSVVVDNSKLPEGMSLPEIGEDTFTAVTKHLVSKHIQSILDERQHRSDVAKGVVDRKAGGKKSKKSPARQATHDAANSAVEGAETQLEALDNISDTQTESEKAVEGDLSRCKTCGQKHPGFVHETIAREDRTTNRFDQPPPLVPMEEPGPAIEQPPIEQGKRPNADLFEETKPPKA